jgi:hypothetical protein
MGEIEVDQRLRDLQREYLDFLDDEVLKLLYCALYVKTYRDISIQCQVLENSRINYSDSACCTVLIPEQTVTTKSKLCYSVLVENHDVNILK